MLERRRVGVQRRVDRHALAHVQDAPARRHHARALRASRIRIPPRADVLKVDLNGRTSLAVQYANYTGRVCGAVWGGAGVGVGMRSYVGLELGIVGVAALGSWALWRDMKAKTG